MKRKKKTDREVLKELFPKEIVQEVDAVLHDVDERPRYVSPNPSTGKLTRVPKPWGRKWTEGKKKRRK